MSRVAVTALAATCFILTLLHPAAAAQLHTISVSSAGPRLDADVAGATAVSTRAASKLSVAADFAAATTALTNTSSELRVTAASAAATLGRHAADLKPAVEVALVATSASERAVSELRPAASAAATSVRNAAELRPAVKVAAAAAIASVRTLTKDCGSCRGIIDYPALLDTSPLGYRMMMLCLCIWMAALIWLLNDTAQEYFVPPLVYWARRLRLSPEVAGATLVALGNGAPDFFAITTATGVEDLPLALSELLGAMLCVLCVTGGCIFLAAAARSGGKAVSKHPGSATPLVGYRRRPAEPLDFSSCAESVVALAAAVAYMAFIMYDGQITTKEAAVMPCGYFVYLVALVGKRGKALFRSGEESEAAKYSVETAPELVGLARPRQGASGLEVAAWVVAWPTYALRWAVIPPADLHWDQRRRVVSAFCPLGLAALWLSIQAQSGAGAGEGDVTAFPLAYYACLAGAAVTVSLGIFLGSDNGPEVPNFYPALTLVSKGSSILVLSTIAGELTACIETLGLAHGVSRLWLGSSVLAWGNSIGDLVTGVAMVRKGQTRTAMTGLFAGPLFNCLVSGGMAMAMAARSSGGSMPFLDAKVDMFQLRLNVVFLVAALAVVTVALLSRKATWRLWPASLFALYAGFFYCIFATHGPGAVPFASATYWAALQGR